MFSLSAGCKWDLAARTGQDKLAFTTCCSGWQLYMFVCTRHWGLPQIRTEMVFQTFNRCYF